MKSQASRGLAGLNGASDASAAQASTDEGRRAKARDVRVAQGFAENRHRS
jgi:hypothetical protein